MGHELPCLPVDRQGRVPPEPEADPPREVIIGSSLGRSECVAGGKSVCFFVHPSVQVFGALSATTTLRVATTGYADTFG